VLADACCAVGQNGTISELLAQNGIPTTIQQHLQAVHELGGLGVLGSPKADNMYHAGWAWAGSTPYQATKLIASHFGGTRRPMAVRWPAKITPSAPPRWTTYDAKFFGVKLPEGAPTSIQERAYTSPIWYTPEK
jgi:hypothetical protein